MLAREHGDAIEFLGSAFLVDARGYLLTAAHLAAVGDGERLVAVPSDQDEDFWPMTAERVAAMPVTVAARDTDHDVALLKIEQQIEIGVPDDFLGSTVAVRQGASVMALGYSFGHHQVHTAMVFDAVVTGKIRSRNDTALILYGSAFHEGDRGGPLIHVQDGHIVGIISGRFEPDRLVREAPEGEALATPEMNVSYAVAIEYGLALIDRIPDIERAPRNAHEAGSSSPT